jgi:hypothetical protein
MTDGTIVALTLTGGFCVLISYYFITLSGVGAKMYRIFTENEKKIFIILSMLSIVSFFYLFYWASFTSSLTHWRRDLYIASVATYLVGASLWSVAAYKIIKMKYSPNYQRLPLLITALGTIGVLIAVGFTDRDNLEYSFAMLAAILFLIQHSFFDLFYWSKIYQERYRKRSFR